MMKTQPKTKPDILIVDDDEAVRASLMALLDAMAMKASAVGSADEAFQLITKQAFDCILLDVAMPVMDGLAALRVLRSMSVTIPVIMITGHGEVAMAVEAMKNGADDFLEKPLEDDVLLEAIQLAIRREKEQSQTDRAQAELIQKFQVLTPREKEIAAMVVRGHSTHSIAANLSISPRTVDHHRSSILAKMEAASLAHLMRMLVKIPDIN